MSSSSRRANRPGFRQRRKGVLFVSVTRPKSRSLVLAACKTLAQHRGKSADLACRTAEYPQRCGLSWRLVDSFVRLEPVRKSSGRLVSQLHR